MDKKFIPLIVGAVLALLASFMVGTYLNQREKAMMERAKEAMVAFQRSQVGVFVARKDIPPNMPILPDMVDKVIAPRNQVHPRAIQFFSDVTGKESAAFVKAGSQITYDLLKESTTPEGVVGQFSLVIPEGKRAVTMRVENMAPLIGKVMPGDHVDVIGVIPSPEKRETVSVTLFQNILVLAVGEEFIAKGPQPSAIKRALKKGERKASTAPTTVTAALTPEQTSVVSYVQEHGKIKLAMRFPLDTGEKLLPVINANALYQFLSSRGFVAPTAGVPEGSIMTMGVEPKKVGGAIEIYRGGKKGE